MTDEEREGSLKGLRRLVRSLTFIGVDATRRFNDHDGSAMAGHITYTILLALFPFLIFATSVAGFVFGAEHSAASREVFFEMLPENVGLTLQPVLEEVLGTQNRGLLSVSAIGTLWIASTGYEAIRIAFDRAYRAELRAPFWKRRVIAIGVVLVAIVVFLSLGLLIVAGPMIVSLADDYLDLSSRFLHRSVRLGVSTTILCAFVILCHKVLPSRSMRYVRVWPGVLFTTVIWMAAASLFSVFLRFAPNYAITYGTMAGGIVAMLFFYLTSALIIFGAEINAALLARNQDAVGRKQPFVAQKW